MGCVAVYGIFGWGGAYDASLEPLIRLQRRILKINGKVIKITKDRLKIDKYLLAAKWCEKFYL